MTALTERIHKARLVLRERGFEVVRADCATLLGLHLWRLFRLLDVGAVIDVGAREGDYGAWLRRNGYDGWIYSFEPVSASFAALQARAAADGRWVAYNHALGAEEGEATINVTRLSFFSSFRTPLASAGDTFGADPDVVATETVRIATLDSVVAGLDRHDPTKARYLKLDTQGWDLEVLRGATATLPDIAALQSEVSVVPLYEGMPTMVESLAYLAGAGFDVSALFPVNMDQYGRAVELDCVAVRRPPA